MEPQGTSGFLLREKLRQPLCEKRPRGCGTGGGLLYIYPDNLKARAILWLWQLKDIGIIGVCALVSILTLTQTGFFLPIVLTAVYAFLTIRFEDTSILDFIRYACGFFFLRRQFFVWRYTT